MKKTLKRHELPETITSDGLRSYRAAMSELGNAERQGSGAGPTAGGEQQPAVPTTRAGYAEVQADEDAAEVRILPCHSTTTSLRVESGSR